MKTIHEMMEERRYNERKEAFLEEQMDVLRSLDHKRFADFLMKHRQPLPPGKGAEDVDTLTKAMHMRRLVLKTLEMPERMKSARFLLACNIPLPPVVILQGDAMTGKLVDVA